MVKIKKLLRGFAVASLLIGAAPLHHAFAATYLETSKMVSVSTTPASPTLIIAATTWQADVGILLNWSGSGTKPNGEYLLLSSASTGFNTSASSGTARVVAGNSESERMWLTNYSGPLYGVIVGTTSAQTVSVLRRK